MRAWMGNGATEPQLSASLKHFLMTGEFADARLPDWLQTLLTISSNDSDDDLKTAWRDVRDELMAEARQHGFTPAASVWFDEEGPEPDYTDDVRVYQLPPDPARDAWSRRFCDANKY